MLCSAQGARDRRRRLRACSPLPADAPHRRRPARRARARRHADHAQAHAQSRRLPVAARHRARRRGRHRRAADAARRRAGARHRRRAPRGAGRRLRRPARASSAASSRASTPRAPTPAWMKERLERSGIRVDLRRRRRHQLRDAGTRPAAARLRRPPARRRHRRALRASRARQLTLLNGQVLELEPDLLLVADERKPLGLAGIMGGEHSGIGDATTTVFLEGAFWNPAVIQGKSRRLGFASDAGYRFERGVDFGGCAARGRARDAADPRHLRRPRGPAGRLRRRAAAARPRARAPGARRPAAGHRGAARPRSPRSSTGSASRYARDGDDFLVTPPVVPLRPRDRGRLRRGDRPAARLRRDSRGPGRARAARCCRTPRRALRCRRVEAPPGRARLAGGDHLQLRQPAWEAVLFPARDADAAPIAVLNPIASHLDVMRTTLLGGLLEVLRTNLARKRDRVRVFEIGPRASCAPAQGHRPAAAPRRARLRRRAARTMGRPPRPVDLFDVKADLEALAAPRTLTTDAAAHPALHPGRSARVLIDGAAAGWLGELHPRLARHFDLPRAPVLFELDLAAAARPAGARRRRRSRSCPSSGATSRSSSTRPSRRRTCSRRSTPPGRRTVDAVRLFDVYRGPGIEAGKKSLAILVLMQDTERTLTDAEIDATVARLLRILADRFGATLRQ